MPVWLPGVLASLGVGLVLWFLTFGKERLTSKSAAETARELDRLHGTQDRLKDDVLSIDDRLRLENRLTNIEAEQKSLRLEVSFAKDTQADLLRFLEKALIPVAHSPHTPELDKLLEKRDRGEPLSAAEWEEVIWRLGEEAKNPETPPGKAVALGGLQAVYFTMLRQAKMRELNDNRQRRRAEDRSPSGELRAQ